MDYIGDPSGAPGVGTAFNKLPIDVLLELVLYTDVGSAIKVTLVSNSFLESVLVS